jgi:hypothetical protein
MHRGVAAVVCGIWAWGNSLSGQVLRGTLVEEGSRQAVVGGLVQLLSPGDSITVSVTTNERGRFVLPEVPQGTYRLRALRIGYQPWTSAPFALAAGETHDDSLAIPAIPVVLEEITVEAQSPCRSSPSQDRRMALLWDEVRTALGIFDAAVGDSLEFHTRLTERTADSAMRSMGERAWVSVGTGRWPVTSQPPETLAAAGYVMPGDTLRGPVYYGPDAAVFFSEAFLRTHCFRLMRPPKQDPSLVGLGFEPVKGRRVIDIAGTLWLDRRTAELRTLEYHYARLWAWVPEGGAGGALSFGRLATGQVVITGWAIRAPVAAIDDAPTAWRRGDEATRPFFGRGQVRLRGFREETGEVQEVRGNDGRVLWRRDS